jgi:uncharacterized protein (TIGR04255 family)
MEVICQVRFPALSALESERPTEFWNRIRHQFPTMELKPPTFGMPVSLPPTSLPPDVANWLLNMKTYDFVSEDNLWTVSLSRDFLALTCRYYERWEGYRQRLLPVLDAVQEIYQPAACQRVGLRYVDVIQRSALGLTGVPWAELLSPLLVGELASSDIGGDIEHVARDVVFRLNDDRESRVHVRHGLARLDGVDELCYLIDSDVFTDQQMEWRDASRALDEYNRYAGRLFRWCISDRLHAAMEPVGI